MKQILKGRVVFLSIALVILAFSYVHGTSMLKRNCADLTKLAECILVGTVTNVSDGLDGNLPYTEVTIQISQCLKGTESGTYTFRQFGLLQPRNMGNGYTNLNVSPAGWPRFNQDEEVMVFLYNRSPLNGLCTTVGLFQGKFSIERGKMSNAINNLGLFQNVSVPPGQLSKAEQSMFGIKQGDIDAETFIPFIEKAVQNNWFN